MAVEQGIAKTLSFGKQTALGTPKIGASCAYLRRVTATFTKTRDQYVNNEIVSHQQSTGATHGLVKIAGKLNGLLSAGTYSLLFAALLRKDFTAGVSTGAIVTITVTGTNLLNRSSGSFLTDGFKIGDVIRCTGLAAAGDNSKNMLVTSVAALTMGVVRLDGVAITNDASAGESVTISVVGKKSLPPTSGHTNDYYTFEEWYSTISKSELWTDCKPAKCEVGLPATGNATVNFDISGLGRTLGTAQAQTSPTAASTQNVLSAINGVVWINGAAYTVTGLTITIDGNTDQGAPEVGNNTSSDLFRGRIQVSGSFTALFKDTTIQTLYESTTTFQILGIFLDNPSSGTSDFVTFNMTACKVFGDAPDDGEKQIVRTYPFVAQINAAGGTGIANDNTIISIQDSAA